MPTASTKLQRWTDLLAALLVRRYPATFDELARDIPAYSSKKKSDASLMRMFERDKDELRAFGIPIETVLNDEGETLGYRLSSKDFYLPYLCLAERGRPVSKPRKVDKYGYQALSSLTFEPDELGALSSAIARVRELGDPTLKVDAESAARKLAFDLPVGAVAADDGTSRISPRSHPSSSSLEQLNDALMRRKQVRFRYHGVGTSAPSTRVVEPYGLFFLSSHWYLAGCDTDKCEVRNFRLSRIDSLSVNKSRSQSPDYEIPRNFKLREHARSRQAWEIGDGDMMEAVVRIPGRSGAAIGAAQLGEMIPGEIDRRRFRIRRPDVFARWLLSFGGEAIPLSPPALVEEYAHQTRATRAVYDGAA
ncbi:MAG TPA: WYL domain-containing protein [Gemmatimonadaceae bacterium]|nr:WYL domain-containing protein [Gemmatimonadaceae bacterium]